MSNLGKQQWPSTRVTLVVSSAGLLAAFSAWAYLTYRTAPTIAKIDRSNEMVADQVGIKRSAESLDEAIVRSVVATKPIELTVSEAKAKPTPVIQSVDDTLAELSVVSELRPIPGINGQWEDEVSGLFPKEAEVVPLRPWINDVPLVGPIPSVLGPDSRATKQTETMQNTASLRLISRPLVFEEILEKCRTEGFQAGSRHNGFPLMSLFIRSHVPAKDRVKYRPASSTNHAKTVALTSFVNDYRARVTTLTNTTPEYVRLVRVLKTSRYEREKQELNVQCFPATLTSTDLGFGEEVKLHYPTQLWLSLPEDRYTVFADAIIQKSPIAHVLCEVRRQKADDQASSPSVLLRPIVFSLASSNEPNKLMDHFRINSSACSRSTVYETPAVIARIQRASHSFGNRARASSRQSSKPSKTIRRPGKELASSQRCKRISPNQLRNYFDRSLDQELASQSVFQWLKSSATERSNRQPIEPFGKDYMQLRLGRYYPRLANEFKLRGLEPPGDQKKVQIATSEFLFQNETLEKLYRGRFGELKRNLYEDDWQVQADPFSRMLSSKVAGNFTYMLIVNLYTGMASDRYGANQPGGTEARIIKSEQVTHQGFVEISRTTTNERTVYVDRRLFLVWAKNWKGQQSLLSGILAIAQGRAGAEASSVTDDLEKFFDRFPRGSIEHDQLVENLVRFDKKESSIQQEIKDNYEEKFGDAFFESFVYRAAASAAIRPHGSWGRINGEKIGERFTGQFLSVNQLEEIALSRLIERAESLGIEECDITRSIIEGRYVPDPRDLDLALLGLINSDDLGANCQLLQVMKSSGRCSELQDAESAWDKDSAKIRQSERDICEERWRTRFGGLETCVGAETIRNDKPATLTKQNIIHQMY